MKHKYQALFAPRRLHAEIGGKIIDNRKRAKRGVEAVGAENPVRWQLKDAAD